MNFFKPVSAVNELYTQAGDLLKNARSVVALTGAGISTASGIPDFRSPNTGMWSFSNPLDVASIWSFKEQPARFYNWIRPLSRKFMSAQPNPGHMSLARLQQAGLLGTILTQNIDDLHQQAGAEQVFQLHGHTRTATCLGCGQRMDTQPMWDAVSRGHDPAPCPDCGGLLKPDMILFGEELPASVLESAQQAALNCDVMIVAGSSLEVMPAADLPYLARRRGARIIIMNLAPTLMDSQADLVIRENLAVSLPRLAKAWTAQVAVPHS
jgi:NAD-dependent deacetylase